MLHHLKNTITWKSELLISKNGLHSPKLNPDLFRIRLNLHQGRTDLEENENVILTKNETERKWRSSRSFGGDVNRRRGRKPQTGFTIIGVDYFNKSFQR